MKYPNPHYKRTKKSFDMVVSCGNCKRDLIDYKKIGKGALLRLWLNRVVASEMDLTTPPQDLTCPYCGNVLGHRAHVRNDVCYKMRRSYYEAKAK